VQASWCAVHRTLAADVLQQPEYGAAMEFRGRDLLRAEARFLADYCGEDAVRRWHARLSSVERDQLSSSVAFAEEVCRSLPSLIWRVLRSVFDAVSAVVRSLCEALVTLITGGAPGSFDHRTP
jgi:hypothetical protein